MFDRLRDSVNKAMLPLVTLMLRWLLSSPEPVRSAQPALAK